VEEYLALDVPVGKYLADQLLVPVTMAGGVKFRTLSPTRHTMTNIEIIRKFLDIDIRLKPSDRHSWNIEIGS
jgi:RNA 3'-terminal phosphate cyclase (ATP)